MKEVNQVIQTNDYDIFQHIDGNRTVNQLHLKRLKDSINEEYIPVPIVVNNRYQIIDGQHRFEAVKEMKKPVYFIKIQGLGLEQVHRLNKDTKDWNADDFLEGYCRMKKEDYLRYREFKEHYGFGHNETNALLTNLTRAGGSHIKAFKYGMFKIKDYKIAEKNAEKIYLCRPYYEDGYKRRSFVYAMLTLFANDDYNHSEFLNKLSYQAVKLQDCTDVKGYLTLIEEIYNFNRAKSKRVRFY